MSRKTSPVVIGAFVVGAVTLAIIAVLVFGGSRFFQDKRYFVTYFDGSVTGLRVGSNVLFRGVRVGYVTDIGILTDASLASFTVPVTYQILPEAFTVLRAPADNGGTRRADIRNDLIDRGLRAKLEVESYVTGQLVIQLDFYPDARPPADAATVRRHSPHPEIPSVPSGIEQALANVQEFIAEISANVDVQKLVGDLQNATAGLSRLANSPELESAIRGIDRLVNDEEFQALPGSARTTLSAVENAAGAASKLIDRGDAELAPTLAEARSALKRFGEAMDEATQTLEAARLQLDGESMASYQLGRTLDEIRGAARSLRVLTEYLERNPEALLRGKQD